MSSCRGSRDGNGSAYSVFRCWEVVWSTYFSPLAAPLRPWDPWDLGCSTRNHQRFSGRFVMVYYPYIHPTWDDVFFFLPSKWLLNEMYYYWVIGFINQPLKLGMYHLKVSYWVYHIKLSWKLELPQTRHLQLELRFSGFSCWHVWERCDRAWWINWRYSDEKTGYGRHTVIAHDNSLDGVTDKQSTMGFYELTHMGGWLNTT